MSSPRPRLSTPPPATTSAAAMLSPARLGVRDSDFRVQDLDAAIAALRSARSVAVVGHVRPDADAVGSVSALMQLAEALGARARGYIDHLGGVARNLSSIPRCADISWEGPIAADSDCVVVVDCGDLHRAGRYAEQIAAGDWARVMIDHHEHNPGVQGVNLIAPRADSTTAVIWLLAQRAGVELNESLAHALYAGLVTDTGGFAWSGNEDATSRLLLAAALAESGIDTGTITADLMDRSTVAETQMLGRLLAGVEAVDTPLGRAAILIAPYAQLSTVPPFVAERAVTLLHALEDAAVCVVAKEQQPGRWNLSLRSEQIDVAALARRHGGGGHIHAAGLSMTGTEEDCWTLMKDYLLQ
ncbi:MULTISPECIES: DHH family phosphoesterase [Corynebacterium]|uniref:DHH family phosphoesterase n=1 Tax=Corynebacterium TaxID=1716 RepID=UPI00124DCE18|nr:MULTISPECIES: DHH family phosphoesterase [Corynebacterium]